MGQKVLVAAPTTGSAATIVPATAEAATAPAATILALTREIDLDRPTVDDLTVHLSLALRSGFVGRERHEPEPLGPTSRLICDHTNFLDLAKALARRAQRRLVRRPGQPTHEQLVLLHQDPP